MSRSLICPLALLCCLALGACAGDRWVYSAPGVSDDTMRNDLMACKEESLITRLEEDQKTLVQRCMMDHGYTMKAKP